MITKNQEITLEQTSILLWIKALNDFTEADTPDDTLDVKINKLDVESIGLERETFEKGLHDLCEMEILRQSEAEQEIELTMLGKAVMAALSTMKCLPDETVQKILNGTINTIEFVKEHRTEILNVITLVFMQFRQA